MNVRLLKKILPPPLEFEERENGVIAFRWNIGEVQKMHFGSGERPKEMRPVATPWQLTDEPHDADILCGEVERALLKDERVRRLRICWQYGWCHADIWVFGRDDPFSGRADTKLDAIGKAADPLYVEGA